eukprot:scaffold100957_cov21-Tisochrysis_lutea.AAC.1
MARLASLAAAFCRHRSRRAASSRARSTSAATTSRAARRACRCARAALRPLIGAVMTHSHQTASVVSGALKVVSSILPTAEPDAPGGGSAIGAPVASAPRGDDSFMLASADETEDSAAGERPLRE